MFRPTVCWCIRRGLTITGGPRGQGLHGSARTTAAVRRAIQQRQASLKTLAERYHMNPKTGATWKTRTAVHDAPRGPKPPGSTALTPEQEALCVACRRQTLLPLADCLDARQRTLPRLTRSSSPRCCQRHGISRRPAVAGDSPATQTFKQSALGACHLDSAEVHTADGRLSLLAARDRASTLAVAERQEKATRRLAATCRRARIAAVPSRPPTVVTDHGTPGTALAPFRRGAAQPQEAQQPHGVDLMPAVDDAGEPQGRDHRLTKPGQPWTNGQVERLNRTRKEATVKRHDADHRQS
jgi:transposase InsO family protein